MSITKAVLPVAGLGTRLLPATKSQPKEMLPVGHKPVIQYVVEELVGQGIDTILFVTGRKKRSIEDHFDDDPELDARLSSAEAAETGIVDFVEQGVGFYYVRQRRPTGNADAVRLAADFVGDQSFVVGFGDTIIHSPERPAVVSRMVESHEKHGASATIGVWEVPPQDTRKYGVVKPAVGHGVEEDDFPIVDIVEKPGPDSAPSCLAVAARYVFTPAIFGAIDAVSLGLGGERWLTDAIQILLARGETVRCVKLRPDEWRYDIGTPQTYYQAFVDFALTDPEHGPEFARYLRQKLGDTG
jgi:UTP--glucose-1-phosphate uridylyltransferase